MTNNQPDDSNLAWFTRMQQLIEGIGQRVDSNALAIEALGNRTRELREEAAEERQELREATLRVTNLAEGIANLTVSLDSDRPMILAILNSIENKVNQLLKQERLKTRWTQKN